MAYKRQYLYVPNVAANLFTYSEIQAFFFGSEALWKLLGFLFGWLVGFFLY